MDFIEECNITTTGSTITTTALNLASTTTTEAVPTDNPSDFKYGSMYFYVVVGCGVLGVSLIVAIFVVCLVIYLVRRRRQYYQRKTQTAPLEEEKEIELQTQGKVTNCSCNEVDLKHSAH